MKKVLGILLMIPAGSLLAGPQLKSEQGYRADSQQVCAKEWTKRGELNNRMYNHCMEQQMEGYRDLKELHRYADQTFYSKYAFPYCSKEWTKRGVVNTRMMAHCLEQEVEGLKDVKYYRDNYDTETVDRISSQALANYGSWRMVAYKVKQYFDN